MESPTEMLALAQQLETAAMAPSQLPPASDELHARLLAAARNLITVLETPETELMHLAKAPVAHGVLRAALRIRLFERFDEGAPTATDLAQRCGTDVALLTRIMRTLASIGIFTEPTPGIYAHTPRSTTLRHAQHRAVIQGMAETATLMTALPDFLDTHHWQNPVDSGPTLFGFAHHTDQTMFEWLEGQPEQRAIFAAFQSGTTALAICQLQPFLRDLLLTSPPPAPAVSVSGSSVSPLVPDQDQDRVTLVDVGGGRGAVLREVSRELLPTRPPGRIVLQDLPNVVEGLGVSDGVEAMPYNFLDPQPVKDAHTYLFRHIFHNWSDSVAHKILQNTAAAMGPSSRVVIVDLVLPDRGASPYAAFLDISMMAFGGLERTEAHWRRFLEEAGLVVRSIEPLDAGMPGGDAVIIAGKRLSV